MDLRTPLHSSRSLALRSCRVFCPKVATHRMGKGQPPVATDGSDLVGIRS